MAGMNQYTHPITGYGRVPSNELARLYSRNRGLVFTAVAGGSLVLGMLAAWYAQRVAHRHIDPAGSTA